MCWEHPVAYSRVFTGALLRGLSRAGIGAGGADILDKLPLYNYAYPLDFTKEAQGGFLTKDIRTRCHTHCTALH